MAKANTSSLHNPGLKTRVSENNPLALAMIRLNKQ